MIKVWVWLNLINDGEVFTGKERRSRINGKMNCAPLSMHCMCFFACKERAQHMRVCVCVCVFSNPVLRAATSNPRALKYISFTHICVASTYTPIQ